MDLRSFAFPCAKARHTMRAPDLVKARFLSKSPSSSPLSSSMKSVISVLPHGTLRRYCSMASWSMVNPVVFFCTSRLIISCKACMTGFLFSGRSVRIAFKSSDTGPLLSVLKIENSAPYHSLNMVAFWEGVATPRYTSSRIQEASECLIIRRTCP